MTFFGDKNISNISLGDAAVKSVYLGDVLVWGGSEPTPPGPTPMTTPLTLTAVNPGTVVKLAKTGSPNAISLEYSTDGSTWSAFTVNQDYTLTNAGDYIQLRATSTNSTFNTSVNARYTFQTTGTDPLIDVSGNIQYLLKNDGSDFTPSSGETFHSLFDSAKVRSAANLVLPATNVRSGEYGWLFNGCTTMTTPPAELPSTQITTWSYAGMFTGSGITTAPTFATKQAFDATFNSTYKNCTSLTSVPPFKLTSLNHRNCFLDMFKDSTVTSWTVDMTECTSVPNLPSTTVFSASGNNNYTILVPSSLYNSWIAASNWSSISSHIQAV